MNKTPLSSFTKLFTYKILTHLPFFFLFSFTPKTMELTSIEIKKANKLL